MTRLVLFDLFVTNLLLFEHQQKNCSLADARIEVDAIFARYHKERSAKGLVSQFDLVVSRRACEPV